MNRSLSEDELLRRLRTGEVGDEPAIAEFLAELDALISTADLIDSPYPFVSENELRQTIALLERFPEDAGDLTLKEEVSEFPGKRTTPLMIGQYEILAPLGAGGMSVVYKARHPRLDRVVALKVLPPGQVMSSQLLARFDREMKAAGKLRHAHVVAAHDAGESEGVHFLVMEFVDGIDLASLIKRCSPLSIPDACELIRQAASGLQHISDHGMVHRDIKPSNLILARPTPFEKSALLKILDLGLARFRSGSKWTGLEITETGQLIGTILYMAPEQGLEAAQNVDIRADLYSLGATLFKLLTGRAPFEDARYNSTFKMMRAMENESPPELIALRPECPQRLSDFIGRMLAKVPGDRPNSPEEVAEFLAPYCLNADLAALVTRVESPSVSLNEPAAALARENLSRTKTEPQSSTSLETIASKKASSPTPANRRVLLFFAMVFGVAAVFAIAAFLSTEGTLFIEAPTDLNEEIHLSLIRDNQPVGTTYLVPAGRTAYRIPTGLLEVRLPEELTDRYDLSHSGKLNLRRDRPITITLRPRSGSKRALEPPSISSQALENGANTPKFSDLPFVVLRDGRHFRRFKSLAGAIAETMPSDVIEIHGSGPYSIDELIHARLPINLRAAPGVRPCLIPSESSSGFQTIKIDQSLILEGLDIDLRVANMQCYGERIEFQNCRMVCGLVSFGGADFVARDSIILATAFSMFNKQTVRIHLHNCLLNNSQDVFVLGNMASAEITLTHNSIYERAVNGGSLIYSTEKIPVTINASGNIFHFESFHREFFAFPDWRASLAESSFWVGENNIYSGTLFGVLDSDQIWRPASSDDWSRLLGKPESGSRFIRQVDWPIVKLNEQTVAALAPFVKPLLEDSRRRFDIPDLGPEISLLGPGGPYLEYLRREDRKPTELRPEILPGGEFILLKDGHESTGFRSLQAAVDSAKDGDIIELRTDHYAGSVEFSSASGRTLTLRGGPGYRPTLGGVINLANDRLILENLTFDAPVNGSLWDGKNKKFVNHGGIHRMSQCEFLSDSGYFAGRFVAVNDRMPRIEFSRLFDLHYGLESEVHLTLQDCVLRSVWTWLPTPTLGSLTLDGCVVLNAAHRAGRLLPFAAFNLPRDEAVTVHRSYLTAFGGLYMHDSESRAWEPEYNWQGRRNVYSLKSFNHHVPLTFAQWKNAVKQEIESAVDVPLLMDPKLWRLSPGTSGAGDCPDGQDYGADISRIGKAAEPELKAVAP